MDLEASRIITQELEEGEDLLWAGRPARFPVLARYGFYIFAMLLVPLGLFLIAPATLIAPLLLLCVLVMIPPLQVYGVTNQRCIFVNRIFGGQTHSIYRDELVWMQCLYSSSSGGKTVGTIWFYDHPKMFRSHALVRPVFVRQGSAFYKIGLYKGFRTQAFFNVDNMDRVKGLLPKWQSFP